MSIEQTDNHQDDEIPLLEDVVAPEEVVAEPEFTGIVPPAPASAESSVPAYDDALLNLRDEIMTQLEEDLRPMIAQAVDRAIAEATDRIGQILHDELDHTLEHHIRGLIARHMEKEFGPRERHLEDDGQEW
jgi:hypothetical protein